MILRKYKPYLLSTLSLVLVFVSVYAVYAWTSLPVTQDPLVRMPGTQPNQVALQAPTRCLNCHAGYDPAVEPGFNWKGSMMAQAARDFLFWSCFTVSAQDSIWAVGRPNATDICERCHFPKGWLEGRSDPTNASQMTGADFDGVQCDFCHRMWDPFFETTYSGAREGSDWLNYWDETNASGTPSQPAADATYADDMTTALSILQFNGTSFYTNNLPPPNYTESGSGQYFISPNAAKRASFADANARHQMFYSRFHKSRYMCDTCHDVSNPILANLGADPAQPLPSELNSAFSYFHVERTFSEFMLSAYGQQGGAATNPEFQAQAPGITHAAKCQDCHMRDVVGPGADLRDAVVRPSQSVEHPQSGQPLHDMTGGNAWVSWVLASATPGSPNFDQFNADQLNQGPATLTLDLTQGEGIDPVALLAGVDRAKQQLLLAATIKDLNYKSGELSFKIQNNGAHKLISGFPEGRRMFVNIRAYNASGNLVHEVNPYDAAAGTLKGLDYPYQDRCSDPTISNQTDCENAGRVWFTTPQPLTDNETYVDGLVYEMKPSSSDQVADTDGFGLTGEAKTFHFALATGRYKDNRIPPKGFDLAEANARKSLPVLHGDREDATTPWIYTNDEYAGGYDDIAVNIPVNAKSFEVNLYYQTTSREYIEFLRDEINGNVNNQTLPSPPPGGEAEAYIIQDTNHPQAWFFDGLRAWGDTIWRLWTHNMNVDGAAPFLMASATTEIATVCGVPAPTLNAATPGHTQVTLEWSAATGATGYNVYYDQAGKAQFVANAGNNTTYLDTSLTNGVEYCYKVTAYDATCESGFSNILCAIPNNQGQAQVGVSTIETGRYVGTTFEVANTFNAGEEVVIRAYVVDASTGLPVPNATVSIDIAGPVPDGLISSPSDVDGVAEATWNTSVLGPYTAKVTNVTAEGYTWDDVMPETTFTIQEMRVGVTAMETGIYTGKGNARTYTPQTTFAPGDGVVIRATVLDGVTGLPVADATVDLLITGPESLTLVTGPSDADGMAEATWQTQAPRKNNPGTTPGAYTVTVTNVTAAGYTWDGLPTSTAFTIQ